jgi:drug/metabolite transporter (DMT)-like permease
MALGTFPRRVLAGALGAFGVVLMLATPDTRIGVGVLVLAAVIEVVGVLIDRRR